nr:hypothetical protein [uncultured Bacteroides sp.]
MNKIKTKKQRKKIITILAGIMITIIIGLFIIDIYNGKNDFVDGFNKGYQEGLKMK